jgi:hypothetical protein
VPLDRAQPATSWASGAFSLKQSSVAAAQRAVTACFGAGHAPAVGTGFDNTAANALDVFFTQTVATGSLTVHNYRVDALN